MDIDRLITVTDAAKMLGYTTAGIRKAIKDGRLLAGRKGKIWLIEERNFNAFRDGKETR